MNNKDLEKQAKDFCVNYNLKSYLKTIYKYAKSVETDWERQLLNNPYTLMNINGVGFVRADKIAMALNFDREHPYRILAYLDKALDDVSQGSTIIVINKCVDTMEKELMVDKSTLLKNILFNKDEYNNNYLLLDQGFRVTEEPLSARYITKKYWYQSERDFYNFLLNASKLKEKEINQKKIDKVLSEMFFKLNEGQLEALNSIPKHGLNILTGVAGGGKTTVVKCILKYLLSTNQNFVCLSPTGISAKVFQDSTGYNCRTVHKMYHKKENIETDWIIMDECSMYSVEHIRMIAERVTNKDIRVLMIGDVNQLQPIAPASPFRDVISLIKNGVLKGNIVELTEIMRASEETFIPYLCKCFTSFGEYQNGLEKQEHNGVYFHKLGDSTSSLLEKLDRVINKYNLDFSNSYILCPQNVGDIGNDIINKHIHEMLCKNEEILFDNGKKIYRKNAILMHVVNNSELDIYNGEKIILLGKIEEDYLCKRIDTGEEIIYDKDTLEEETRLSYSVTVHKTQGITSDNIVFIISKKHYYMLNRNLVYTALSRASKKLIVLYDDNMMNVSSKRYITNKRVTFLGEISKIKARKK